MEGYGAGSVLLTNGYGRPKNILFVLVRLVVNQYGIRIRSIGESLTLGFESAGTSWQASVLQPSHACGLARQESNWSREEARGKCFHQEPESEGALPKFCFVNVDVASSVADPDPGSGAYLTPDPGSGVGFFRIPDSDPKPIFWELEWQCFGQKVYNSL